MIRAYRQVRTGTELVDRNLDGIAANLADVNRTPSVRQISGHSCTTPIVAFTVGAESVVVFRGGAAVTGTLPGAASLGPGISREVTVINDSAVILTMAPGSGDSLSGTAAIAAGAKTIWRSDGASKWFRVV